MTGHETANVNKVELEIPADLFDLYLHLAKHIEAEPLHMMEMTALMGLAEITNSVQRRCFAAHLVRYLETHGERLGMLSVMAEPWEDRRN